MLDHNDIAQRVLEIAPDNITLIVIFGSRARGDHSKHSDLDLAVSTSFQDKEKRFKLRLQVISLLEGPEQPVDVVLLEDCNWTLRHQIARDGVVIFQYRHFEQQFLKDALGGS